MMDIHILLMNCQNGITDKDMCLIKKTKLRIKNSAKFFLCFANLFVLRIVRVSNIYIPTPAFVVLNSFC